MSALSDFTPSYRVAIHHRDNNVCAYCDSPLWVQEHDPDSDTVIWHYVGNLDHVTAQAHGGTHGPDNLISACNVCNNLRGCRKLETFLYGVIHRQNPRAARRRLAYIYAQLLIPIDRQHAQLLIRNEPQRYLARYRPLPKGHTRRIGKEYKQATNTSHQGSNSVALAS